MLYFPLSITPYAVVPHTNVMVRSSDLLYIKEHKELENCKFLIIVLPYIKIFMCVKISGTFLLRFIWKCIPRIESKNMLHCRYKKKRFRGKNTN